MMLSIISTSLYIVLSLNSLNESNKDSNHVLQDANLCKVKCSTTIFNEEGEPTLYEATGGGLFTSCEKAVDKCKEKLDNAIND